MQRRLPQYIQRGAQNFIMGLENFHVGFISMLGSHHLWEFFGQIHIGGFFGGQLENESFRRGG